LKAVAWAVAPLSTQGASRAIVALAVAFAPLLADNRTAHAQATAIDTLALRGHSYYLSHDRLQGRDTASPGARLAALYLASVCENLGLRPLGTSFYQTVAIEEARILPETSLQVGTADRHLLVRYPDVVPHLGDGRTPEDFRGPALYLGPAERVERGLPVDLDLHGAVAITLGTVSGATANILGGRGAAGLVQLIPDTTSFRGVREHLGDRRLYLADSTIASSYLPRLPSVVAGAAATLALARAGGPIDPRLTPSWLGFEITVRIARHRTQVEDRNVLCLLESRGGPAADSLIVFAAHYDHLGVGPADAAGDSVYNGFSDNAAGVSMLLALAQAFRHDSTTPFRHAVLFLFLTGEERGLLGADSYVSRAPWPLDRTVAVITLDAGAPPAPPTSWELAGGDSTALGKLGIRVASEWGWSATTSRPRPVSDFYPFVSRGIPAVLIIPGPGSYDGLTADSSDALRRRWDHYHHPADEWSAVFPLSGLRRYAEYAALIARAVDQGRLGGKDR
jgi:hypothetical protein